MLKEKYALEAQRPLSVQKSAGKKSIRTFSSCKSSNFGLGSSQVHGNLYVNQVWKAWVFTNPLSSSHPLDVLAQVP